MTQHATVQHDTLSTVHHYAFNERVYLRSDPRQYGRIGCNSRGIVDCSDGMVLVFWEHENADIVSPELIADLMSEEEYAANNISAFFGLLADHLKSHKAEIPDEDMDIWRSWYSASKVQAHTIRQYKRVICQMYAVLGKSIRDISEAELSAYLDGKSYNVSSPIRAYWRHAQVGRGEK